MPDTTNHALPDDQVKEDVQKALLAAFGDDAMDWLDEDDGLELEMQTLAQASDATPDVPVELPTAKLNDQPKKFSYAIGGRTAAELTRDAFLGKPVDDAESLAALGPRYVVFEVGNQQYGIPLNGVLEIDRCGKVTSLPRTPNWLRGVISLRGQILSVTDFRNLLGVADQRAEQRPGTGGKIVVVRSELHNARTALVVDRVLGIRHLRGEQGTLEGLSDRLAVFADSLAVTDQTTTVLIDPDRLLGCNELAAFVVE